jgi:hypothetical protein
MALPEDLSLLEDYRQTTSKPYPADYENTIKVVLEYMGEMDEESL